MSTLLVLREIKITVRYHFMPSRMVIMKKTITSADKNVEKLLYCWWVKW